MKTQQVKPEPPVVVSVAVQTPEQSERQVESSMIELAELLKTLGAVTCNSLVQKRQSISRANYLGTGKLLELKQIATDNSAEFIAVDDELSALQIKNIEAVTGLPVKDRTSIILEIFASHATTKEGKLQVELAMHHYQLPRLLRKWTHLERQRGGIGLKGPGETQLETDRRILNRRIKKLNQELEKVSKIRNLQGKKRFDNFAPLFSLVGYTNAGKSTLLNCLSDSNLKMCDGLFTTLDPTARKIDLPQDRWCIVSDTVGFIRKLPHNLINAFHATLESVVQSEILLLVTDVSNPDFRDQIEAVEKVLSQIGASEHEIIHVFNKIDRGLAIPEQLLDELYPGNIKISALQSTNIDMLKSKLSKIMGRNSRIVELNFFHDSPILKQALKVGRIINQRWLGKKTIIKAELPLNFLKHHQLI